MAVGTPTTNQGVSITPTVAVPSGVASGDIVVLLLAQDATNGVFTGKWPSGFTALLDADGTADGQSYGAAWKRLTGSDSGSYTMTADVGISAGYAMTAIPLTGRHATDPPVLSANSLQNTAQSSPITVTANGVTAVAGDDILFFSMPDVTATGVGNGHSSWAAGYTEIVDLEETASGWSNIGVAKAEAVSAGATGSKTVTFSLTGNTAGWGAWLLRVPAGAAGGQTVNPSAISSGSTLYAPTIQPGSVTVSPTAISSTDLLYAPSVATSVTVAPAAILSGEQVYAPTITPGSVTVSPALLASGAQVYQATTDADATLTPAAIASTAQVHQPRVDLTASLAAIAAGSQVYTPTLTPGSVTVSPALLASGAQVYTPTLEGGDTPVATRFPWIPSMPQINNDDIGKAVQ